MNFFNNGVPTPFEISLNAVNSRLNDRQTGNKCL